MGFQHQRGNVLSAEERVESARKCLGLLKDLTQEDVKRSNDWNFLRSQREASNYLGYKVSEPSLQWLRDLVERYITS